MRPMSNLRIIITMSLAVVLSLTACGRADAADVPRGKSAHGKQDRKDHKGHWKPLSAKAKQVIEGCGTERAFTGKFLNHKAKGTYTCGRCDAPLFSSKTKFKSGSGWPSFDQALPGAVKEVRDRDGSRTEIQCARCGAHLGHVFRGERMTSKNTRHCVNSVSLSFAKRPVREAFFAGGCFWGVEHLLEGMPGVISATSGYMGGHLHAPTYKKVTSGRTGHAETVRVRFDPTKTSFEQVARRFFEIHDPTQVNRQGPDRGPQYRSAIFATNSSQERIAYKLVGLLKKKGLKVATKIEAAHTFWPAEKYHQNWYKKKGSQPYCHARTRR
ncbi:MAG: bifunctional methionine sulfoxide reductase B/A protein, partial [Myxococcales bacterium]|nr:bifunctional methionine sulfoxide reductase B/A protein [Myxococcales bacterium]